MAANRFLIKSRLDVPPEAWDSFADKSDEAWLWHRYVFQDTLATWGKTDHSFAVFDEASPGSLIAICPLHLTKSNLVRVIPYHTLDSLGGIALQNELGTKYRRKISEFIRNHLLTLAQQQNVAEINLTLSPMAPAYRGENCPRVNPLLELGCLNSLTQTYVLNLQNGSGKIWDGMETRARTLIRKAEKSGVTVRLASSRDIDIYYDLHCQTYQRNHITPHPKAYFKAIGDYFLPEGLSVIFLAELDGKIVAAENFGFYKNGTNYWTGASSVQGLELGASSLLQWYAIQHMVAQKAEWYEVGEGFPATRTGKAKGLNDFKKSFGGELYPYYRGRLIRTSWRSKVARLRA